MRTLGTGWAIECDPDNVGRANGWAARGPSSDARAAAVPGLIQQVFPAYHGVAWYWTTFDLAGPPAPCERCLLRFDAVDYLAQVWVNGTSVGAHEGGETPFTVDATPAVRPGRNLLAVRVLNPTDEGVDGIVLNQTAHRNKRSSYSIGWSFNRGGIVQPVSLAVLPAVRVADAFARPEMHTGIIRLTVTIRNDLADPSPCRLTVTAGPAAGGDATSRTAVDALAAPGTTEVEAALAVADARPWSPQDPFLYRAELRLEASPPGGPALEHGTGVRFGFRELAVRGGYFRLNGRRLFLRCSHTGNDWPTGMPPEQVAEAFRRDVLHARAAGFNTLRFIAGMATPDQLDYCDEVGLMVYEEALSSWCLEDSPRMAERFDAANADMIRRDRNHPSVVIWGLLNETMDGPVFRHAVAALPLVRSLDPTRLVLLNTGRMDCELGIGSVSNPGSAAWEHQWGGEAPGAARHENLKEPHTFGGYPGGYFERVGDAHLYPPTPHTPETIRFLRTLGQDTKPVYLGEYGIASNVNAIRVTRRFEQAGARPDLEDAVYYRAWAEQYAADWHRFGMEDVAPFPEDILRQSQELHAAQRLLGLNAIRSNPRISGYNLTGTVDQGMTAEGMWTTWRELKPGVLDAVAEGWAPLRWCLFAEPLHVYRGASVRLDAVLADEDVLVPGDYPVTARVFGPGGCVWERSVVLTVPPNGASERPLAVPVLSEELTIDGPAGEYRFAVQMDRGAAPAGGRAAFHVGDWAALPKAETRVTVWEAGERVRSWLASRGIAVRRFAEGPADGREVILVGDLSGCHAGRAEWHDLARRMASGGTAVFLDPAAFRRPGAPDGSIDWLPLPVKGRCDPFANSIYHREDVSRRHPVFDGLPAGGIMDWGFYRDVIPHRIFTGQEAPPEVVIACFALGYTCPTGYTSGFVTGAYPFGAGRFMVNTLRLLEHLGTHPVADRIALNMVCHAARSVDAPLAPLLPDFPARLATIGY